MRRLPLGFAEGGLLELLLVFAAGAGAGGLGGGLLAGGALYFLALDLVGDAGGVCHGVLLPFYRSTNAYTANCSMMSLAETVATGDLVMPRITLDADRTFNHTLENLVETTPATSKAEVIRNAVAVYSYLKNVLPKDNGSQSIVIQDAVGDKKHVLIP